MQLRKTKSVGSASYSSKVIAQSFFLGSVRKCSIELHPEIRVHTSSAVNCEIAIHPAHREVKKDATLRGNLCAKLINYVQRSMLRIDVVIQA
jgi:hypothetical protein